MRANISIPLFVVLLLGCSKNEMPKPTRSDSVLTQEQIAEIAKKSSIANHLGTEDLTVWCDPGNEEWLEVFAEMEKEDPDGVQAIKRALKGRGYQAVRIHAGPNIVDGSFWILIDSETGEEIIGLQD